MIFSRFTTTLLFFLALAVLLPGSTKALTEKAHQTITDLRGIQVKIPVKIKRVVTIDDGLTEGIMTILGESSKIVGLGSRSLRKTSSFTIPSVSGKDHSFKDAMNPVRYLNPRFADLPLLKENGGSIHFEALASLKPDIVIMRVGTCSASWGISSQALNKNINVIESLGIPVVVLFSPPSYDSPNLKQIPEEINIIGRIFGKEQKAIQIADYMESCIKAIEEKTKDITDVEKPRVLAIGLSSKSRSAGGAGNVRSGIMKYYIEEIVNAKSAFTVKRHTSDTGLINTEKVYAINPDVIVLTTSFGYHPPEELYSAPYYQVFQDLKAVQNKRISALPFTPANCDASRLEYPIDLMIIAKSCYPNRFKDIKIHEWVLAFYHTIYGVDRGTAEQLRSAQLLDWTVEADF
ncbi:MAG: ABC transporter substrate-binding protein [Desulfobacterium sp.]|nr:ABC transporter substrate-binding protein [Desulfobacterium sp.]